MDQGIPALTSTFTTRFKSIFPIPISNQTTEEFSQAITSNLLGGIGYFYGSSIEDRGFAYEWDEEDGETEVKDQKGTKAHGTSGIAYCPKQRLLPKRVLLVRMLIHSGPRMLIVHRDEGFHLLHHIGAWDNALSLKILKDWINLVDEDGWEQILGGRAHSRVGISVATLIPHPDVRPAGTMRVPNPSSNLCESTHSRHSRDCFYRKAEGSLLGTR